MAFADKIRLYQSAELDVRYVYGVPVTFPFAHHFTDDEKLGTAAEQCDRLRKAHQAAKEAAVSKAEALAERRVA